MKRADAPDAVQIITALLKLSKLQTMKEKYEQLEPGTDHKIRTTLSVVGTETGRLSSSGSFLEPSTNLQNQPKKVALLDPLYDTRACFIPNPGHVFIEADLKQAEVFATAAYSEDDARLERLHNGEDAHKQTATMMFGVKLGEVNKRQRQVAKLSHGLHYGLGWSGLRDKVNSDADITGIAITAAEAKSCYNTFHSTNSRIKSWWQQIEEELCNIGYLRNSFGRRRDFFGRKEASGRPSHEMLKEAIAFLPQSTIADHLNSGLLRLYELENEYAFSCLLQIHDAVLLQTPIANMRAVSKIVRSTLESEVEINFRKVLIPCEISVSTKSWGDMRSLAA